METAEADPDTSPTAAAAQQRVEALLMGEAAEEELERRREAVGVIERVWIERALDAPAAAATTAGGGSPPPPPQPQPSTTSSISSVAGADDGSTASQLVSAVMGRVMTDALNRPESPRVTSPVVHVLRDELAVHRHTPQLPPPSPPPPTAAAGEPRGSPITDMLVSALLVGDAARTDPDAALAAVEAEAAEAQRRGTVEAEEHRARAAFAEEAEGGSRAAVEHQEYRERMIAWLEAKQAHAVAHHAAKVRAKDARLVERHQAEGRRRVGTEEQAARQAAEEQSEQEEAVLSEGEAAAAAEHVPPPPEETRGGDGAGVAEEEEVVGVAVVAHLGGEAARGVASEEAGGRDAVEEAECRAQLSLALREELDREEAAATPADAASSSAAALDVASYSSAGSRVDASAEQEAAAAAACASCERREERGRTQEEKGEAGAWRAVLTEHGKGVHFATLLAIIYGEHGRRNAEAALQAAVFAEAAAWFARTGAALQEEAGARRDVEAACAAAAARAAVSDAEAAARAAFVRDEGAARSGGIDGAGAAGAVAAAEAAEASERAAVEEVEAAAVEALQEAAAAGREAPLSAALRRAEEAARRAAEEEEAAARADAEGAAARGVREGAQAGLLRRCCAAEEAAAPRVASLRGAAAALRAEAIAAAPEAVAAAAELQRRVAALQEEFNALSAACTEGRTAAAAAAANREAVRRHAGDAETARRNAAAVEAKAARLDAECAEKKAAYLDAPDRDALFGGIQALEADARAYRAKAAAYAKEEEECREEGTRRAGRQGACGDRFVAVRLSAEAAEAVAGRCEALEREAAALAEAPPPPPVVARQPVPPAVPKPTTPERPRPRVSLEMLTLTPARLKRLRDAAVASHGDGAVCAEKQASGGGGAAPAAPAECAETARLRAIAARLGQAGRAKGGTTLREELAANLVSEASLAGGDVGREAVLAHHVALLDVVAEELQAVHRDSYPEATADDLLLMRLYTMAGPDIDRLMLFDNVPEFSAHPDSAWGRYTQAHAASRNRAMFAELNRALRAVGSDDEAEQAVGWAAAARWAKTLCRLHMLCAASPTVHDATGEAPRLARGLARLPLPVAEAHARAATEGGQLAWPALSSCTADVSVAAAYIMGCAANSQQQDDGAAAAGTSDAEQPSSVLFTITGSIPAVYLQPLSQYPSEAEVLLPSLSILTVVVGTAPAPPCPSCVSLAVAWDHCVSIAEEPPPALLVAAADTAVAQEAAQRQALEGAERRVRATAERVAIRGAADARLRAAAAGPRARRRRAQLAALQAAGEVGGGAGGEVAAAPAVQRAQTVAKVLAAVAGGRAEAAAAAGGGGAGEETPPPSTPDVNQAVGALRTVVEGAGAGLLEEAGLRVDEEALAASAELRADFAAVWRSLTDATLRGVMDGSAFQGGGGKLTGVPEWGNVCAQRENKKAHGTTRIQQPHHTTPHHTTQTYQTPSAVQHILGSDAAALLTAALAGVSDGDFSRLLRTLATALLWVDHTRTGTRQVPNPTPPPTHTHHHLHTGPRNQLPARPLRHAASRLPRQHRRRRPSLRGAPRRARGRRPARGRRRGRRRRHGVRRLRGGPARGRPPRLRRRVARRPAPQRRRRSDHRRTVGRRAAAQILRRTRRRRRRRRRVVARRRPGRGRQACGCAVRAARVDVRAGERAADAPRLADDAAAAQGADGVCGDAEPREGVDGRRCGVAAGGAVRAAPGRCGPRRGSPAVHAAAGGRCVALGGAGRLRAAAAARAAPGDPPLLVGGLQRACRVLRTRVALARVCRVVRRRVGAAGPGGVGGRRVPAGRGAAPHGAAVRAVGRQGRRGVLAAPGGAASAGVAEAASVQVRGGVREPGAEPAGAAHAGGVVTPRPVCRFVFPPSFVAFFVAVEKRVSQTEVISVPLSHFSLQCTLYVYNHNQSLFRAFSFFQLGFCSVRAHSCGATGAVPRIHISVAAFNCLRTRSVLADVL